MTQKNKKVLIISYYWPPSGGSGVQRWLKFVKYLPFYGWEPHVFTPENPSFAIRDESLLKDVPEEAEIIRFPIWEPYDLFFKFLKLTGKKHESKTSDFVASKNKSLLQNVAGWIRGNFFIPDPRVFWVAPAFRFLNDYIAANGISTIITTGPPHSVHLIGLRLKKKNPAVKWFADFRDPWSEWGLLDSLHVGKWARKRHRYYEHAVLTSADEVITITPFFVRHFEKLGGRKVHLLTNGFDEEDFRNFVQVRPEKFVICHVGIINEKCDPGPFTQALEELMRESSDFGNNVQLKFIGEVHAHVKAAIDKSDALKGIVIFKKSVPHKELMQEYGSASLLLLILTGYKNAEGYLPGKLFEYIATGLPVLGVGPVKGDAAALLETSNTGVMVDSYDLLSIKKELLEQYTRWKKGDRRSPASDISLYSRRGVTGRLVELLG